MKALIVGKPSVTHALRMAGCTQTSYLSPVYSALLGTRTGEVVIDQTLEIDTLNDIVEEKYSGRKVEGQDLRCLFKWFGLLYKLGM